MQRKRSPRFPSRSLSEALDYIRKIYDAVHVSPIDSSTIVQIMGFSGKSGASASALGSVRQYGLLNGIGESTQVSELGLQILEPESADEYQASLRRAAFSPKVFESISERFGGKIPSVDEPIRSYLIRDLGFSQSGAMECIATVRSTLSDLNQIEGQLIDSTADSENRILETELPAEPTSIPRPVNPVEDLQNLWVKLTHKAEFPLSKDSHAELRIHGEVTKKALQNLRAQIEYLVKVLDES